MSTRRSFLTQIAAVGAFMTTNARVVSASSRGQERVMKTYKVPNTDLVVSRIAYGCGELVAWNADPRSAAVIAEAERRVNTAFDNGITFFDLAAIYGFGKAEMGFGEVLKRSPGLREKVVIQSKCGTAMFPALQPPGEPPFRFDSSREEIIGSVEASLQRLRTDRIDLLLLHWPDLLVEPEEVAAAFDELHGSGKARYFGVSNHTVGQIELLKKYVRQPLVASQVQLSLGQSSLIAAGLGQLRDWQTPLPQGHTSLEAVVDYCRLHELQIQAYSPLGGLQRRMLNPPAEATPQIKAAAQVLVDMAAKKNTTPAAVAIAWLLRHPAGIVPIIGATNPKHVAENCAADGVMLSKDEWYALFFAAAKIQPSKLT